MPEKWTVGDLQVGAVMESTFLVNPKKESGFRYRATHLDGRRAPKVVLCDDPRVRPGVPCRVRVAKINKANNEAFGSIEVEFVESLPFRVEGVYLEPVVSKKLQILLESGLNILMDGLNRRIPIY